MSVSSTASLARPQLVLLRPGAERPRSDSDRRAHRRLRAGELPGIDHVRLKYGPVVTLVDLSVGGAQIETANHQLQPGAPLVMQIVGHNGGFAVPAQVLRCHITALGEHPIYSGALEFRRGLEIEELLRSNGTPHSSPEHRPHLVTSLVDVDRSVGGLDGDARAAWALTAAPGLTAARAMIESVSKRRGPECARAMGRLYRTIAPMFERGIARRAIVESALGCVSRLIPGATIRLLDVAQFALVTAEDAFYVDVPSGSDRPPQKLLIEFVRKGTLEIGHLELLRLAAHLVAIAEDMEGIWEPLESVAPDPPMADAPLMDAPPMEAPIAEVVALDPPAPAAAPPASTVAQPGWRKLIVRYRDGRLLKGYSKGLQPGTGHVHVSTVPDGPVSSRITVPLSHLKALFFVHEFEGRTAPPVDAKPRTDLLRGRTVTITFLDGEVLTGTTLTYSGDGPGFFVLPLDEASNNEQIFVVTAAVRHMQFA